MNTRKIEVETLRLPAHWACPLVNGDFTGCERDDEREINAWLRDKPHLLVVSCEDDDDLELFDGCLTNCVTYACHVRYTRETSEGLRYLIYPVTPVYDPLPWQKLGLQQTASGYGRKLTTSNCVYLRGRKHRVYVTQISNAGSTWITFEGQKTYIA